MLNKATMKIFIPTALVAVMLASGAAPAADTGDSIDGRWDASLTTKSGAVIPFRLDLTGSGDKIKGTFYDGFKPYDGTTSASFNGGTLVLNIEHYLTTINAQFKDGQLVGDVVTHSRGHNGQYSFQATRHVDDPTAAAAKAPNVAGSWVIPLPNPSSRSERAVRLIVEQHGAEIGASILRVDGDTGAYSGTYKDGKWVLSHFDGGRPGVITVTANPDGSLSIDQGGDRNSGPLVAWRAETAAAKGLPQPLDYAAYTTARDPHEKFSFNFPDADGKLVSNEDPRFKGKVVLAVVTGTWCPNCHDEAQYLVQLDKKYHDKGLAIVALDFEEPDQQNSLERERAFVAQYGVKYTYLIAGEPSEIGAKVPQLVNLNTFPATVFIGRDGTARGVHAGFSSPATGEFNDQLKREFEGKIKTLLAEKAPAG